MATRTIGGARAVGRILPSGRRDHQRPRHSVRLRQPPRHRRRPHGQPRRARLRRPHYRPAPGRERSGPTGRLPVNPSYTATRISSLTPSPTRAIIALDSAGRKRARRKSEMAAQDLDLFATIEGHCLARMDISQQRNEP